MGVQAHCTEYRILSEDELNAWSGAGSASVSDCLERSMAMDGGIQSVTGSIQVVGQARTVRCMVGDNSALHAAISRVRPGEIIVVDADGFLGNAVWGGLMTHAAVHTGIGGLIVDGAVRDVAEIRDLEFPCFARGRVPAGPHKGFGSAIDCTISCGGVPVNPGDLVVADEDGVTIIPLNCVPETLEKYSVLLEKEKSVIEMISSGGSLADIYGVPEVEELK